LHYWLSHLASDGPIVAPGDGNDAVEVVDVRDVGAWIVDAVERSRLGAYNVFDPPRTFRAFLEEAKEAIGGKARLVWVARELLEKHGVKTFDNMPYWTLTDPASRASRRPRRSRPASPRARSRRRSATHGLGTGRASPRSSRTRRRSGASRGASPRTTSARSWRRQSPGNELERRTVPHRALQQPRKYLNGP
jgi:2'-hydroxyisoflavone reductase